VLLLFEKTTFAGSVQPDRINPNFQLIPNNPSNAQNVSSCQLVRPWNAYYCQNDFLGILLFESLDSDRRDRTVSPITVISDRYNSSTVLNTFMDHIWDGFYTSHKRLSRFPALIQTGKWITLDYTGTAPIKQRFTLIADVGAATIRIKYTKPGAYIIRDAKGNQVPPN
jgi:hypothetical protein